MNWCEIIKKKDRNQIFIVDAIKQQQYTYGEVERMAGKLASEWETEEIDSIIVSLENGLELIIVYFACMFANITVIPFDPWKGQQELNEIREYHVNSKLIDEIGPIQQCIYSTKKISKKNGKGSLCIDYFKEYLITYTSGTTGTAKGVVHSLDNLFHSAWNFGNKLGYDEETIVCHTMPMTYMAGILNTIWMPFIRNSKIVLFPRFDVKTALTFWKNTKYYEVNTFWLSPTMLHILLTVDKKGKMKAYFSHRKMTFCIGTAPLYSRLKEEFESRYQVRLYQSYGTTETLFISTSHQAMENELQSVGECLDEVEIRIGEDEEIFVKAPWCMLRYTNVETSSCFTKEYYHTGDLGRVEESKLYITGRKKDLIIRGGINISPFRMEQCILQDGRIEDCCVSSMVVEQEERIVCWYVTKEGKGVEKYINERVIRDMGIQARIDYFILLTSLPKNLNGKTDKSKLRAEYDRY